MVVRDAKRTAILFFARGGLTFRTCRTGLTRRTGLTGLCRRKVGREMKKRRLRYRNLLLVGEMWVSNPRPSEPQSDALTS